jgi:hypothetical protein
LAAGHSAAIIVESAAWVGSTDFYRHVKLAKTKTRRLKPALLELQRHASEWRLDVGYVPRVNFEWEFLLTTVALCVQS